MSYGRARALVHVDRIGHIGHIGHIDHIGHIGHIGLIGHIGHIGFICIFTTLTSDDLVGLTRGDVFVNAIPYKEDHGDLNKVMDCCMVDIETHRNNTKRTAQHTKHTTKPCSIALMLYHPAMP